MSRSSCLVFLVLLSLSWVPQAPAATPLSPSSEECLDCHGSVHAGIVADWKRSRHAAITPKAAMQVEGLGLKLSSKQVPEALLNTSVGCAECHTLRPEAHADSFEHNGYKIHTVVSPDDCAVCHAVEREQYAANIMSAAHGNLADNALYNDLERTILGTAEIQQNRAHFTPPDAATRADGCYYCHGTRLVLAGVEKRATDVGELEFPVIKGWPNQGVGRVNLDGSRGACTSCHTRHHFSIEMARKPYTCKECHAGPDVPAYKVYETSKHGNLFAAMGSQWNYDHVPWTVGEDFGAPTCAACHISLVVTGDGAVLGRRTHQMSDRLPQRIFGLIYAHSQPKSPNTTLIRNKGGLPLPTDLDGTPAAGFLVDAKEAATRRDTMRSTCRACHGTAWVRGHFERLDGVVAATNAQVRGATRIMQTIWEKGYAQGPGSGGSPFDEAIERRWSDAWLMYANCIRFSSAMAGGGDYGVFQEGRYHLNQAIMEMGDWLKAQDGAGTEKR
ncbi:MAG: hydroxylamine oxidase [Desulfobacterales bacterium]|nr:hydroxylamine oxidase [Desulfobacterales bacterium]